MKTHSPQILNNPYNVRTLTESGFLYHAMQLRAERAAKLQRRNARLQGLKAFFYGDVIENTKKFVGKKLAQMTYALWQQGFFSAFDEFTSPRSA